MPFPGMGFTGEPWSYPTKDEVAEYLEVYASRFELPVQTRVRVDALTKAEPDRFVLSADGRHIEAKQVVVASGAWHVPLVPDFASDLDSSILQMHSSEYRRPAQLRHGPVLVVGAANSGAEIALDIVREHPTILVGRDTGQLPIDDGWRARVSTPLIWFAANHILTIDNPVGRRMRAQERFHGEPVERARPKRLLDAGVERRFARAVGTRDGRPLLDDDTVVDATNIVWATGFRRDFSWIELPIFDEHGWPDENHGVVDRVPGLYFVGLPFQRAMASALVGGVGRDAGSIVRHLAARSAASVHSTDPEPRQVTHPGGA
jgi:putative flavoprotein involved in K+ transport